MTPDELKVCRLLGIDPAAYFTTKAGLAPAKLAEVEAKRSARPDTTTMHMHGSRELGRDRDGNIIVALGPLPGVTPLY